MQRPSAGIPTTIYQQTTFGLNGKISPGTGHVPRGHLHVDLLALVELRTFFEFIEPGQFSRCHGVEFALNGVARFIFGHVRPRVGALVERIAFAGHTLTQADRLREPMMVAATTLESAVDENRLSRLTRSIRSAVAGFSHREIR